MQRDWESWLHEEAQRDHGIRLTGFVDDIYSVLAEYPTMVNPMRIGSGLKNKVLEALAMGLAAVSTGSIEASMAREGIDYMRADEPERTASVIKVLIENERLRLSMIKSARKVMLEHYTWNKVARDLDALLCSLCVRPFIQISTPFEAAGRVCFPSRSGHFLLLTSQRDTGDAW